jgi:hypothetical protein
MTRIKEESQQAVGVLQTASAVAVASLAAVFYVLFTVVALGLHDWDPLWFVWIGERYANLDPMGRTGYDGQFIYYLAGHGSAAIANLDNPAYRLQRITLPLLVRLLSLGSPLLVPWVLILVNLSAIVLTTYLLAKWLKDQNLSPCYALMYALYVGTMMAYSRDLTEPFAFLWAAWGAILWLKARHTLAILALALAALTKETSLIFALGILGSALTRRDFGLGWKVAIAAIPLIVWESCLFLKFGEIPLTSGPSLEGVPLSGILAHLSCEPGRLSGLLFVAIPALLLLFVSLLVLIQERGQSPAVWWLLLNCVFVVLMPFDVYDHIMHAGRNAIGMVLSAVFILPCAGRRLRLVLSGYWILPSLAWLIPVLGWAPWLSEI